MAAKNEVIVGTVGEDIEIDTKIDLTPYPNLSVLVRNPNGEVDTWDVEAYDDDPSTGIVVHTLESGDIDVAGSYLLHVKVQDAAGSIRYSAMTVLKCVDLFSHPHK